MRLAGAQHHIATQISLGNGDATTKHGAIEAFGRVFALDES
jgi:hypothetical protein